MVRAAVADGSRDGEAMTDASAIEAATKRLAAALDALEAALERRRDTDRGENALVQQVHALGTDRSKLASDLDAATARSLEATRASCRAVNSSSNRRTRLAASLNSSPTVSAAITISRISPIAPKLPFNCSMR